MYLYSGLFIDVLHCDIKHLCVVADNRVFHSAKLFDNFNQSLVVSLAFADNTVALPNHFKSQWFSEIAIAEKETNRLSVAHIESAFYSLVDTKFTTPQSILLCVCCAIHHSTSSGTVSCSTHSLNCAYEFLPLISTLTTLLLSTFKIHTHRQNYHRK